jgi:methionyl-tRNA formyltransferase
MKVAYFGYDFFYNCLECVINSGHDVFKIFSYETDNVYNYNDKVKNIANRIGVDFCTSKVTAQDIEYLENNGVELIIVAAYPYKVPIQYAKSLKGINIHPTLLPKGRGVWPLPYVILENWEISGVTIHKLISKMDAGDILIQESFKINNNENLETLSCKSQILASKLLHSVLNQFDFYWQNAVPQDDMPSLPMPSLKQQTINWCESVDDILRKVRAFGKLESCATFKNHQWVIQDASGWEEVHSFEQGTVVHETNKEVLIAAKNGYICLRFFNIDLELEG